MKKLISAFSLKGCNVYFQVCVQTNKNCNWKRITFFKAIIKLRSPQSCLYTLFGEENSMFIIMEIQALKNKYWFFLYGNFFFMELSNTCNQMGIRISKRDVEIYTFFLYLSFLIKVLNDTSDPIVDVCGIIYVIVSRWCFREY